MDRLEASYIEGSSKPDLPVSWRNVAGNLVPFGSQPHTFDLTFEDRAVPGTVVFSKTSGITGYDSDPNLNIVWATGDLPTLAPGIYDGTLAATRTSDSTVRKMPVTLVITRKATATVDPGPTDPPN